jgi:hypothetical protein
MRKDEDENNIVRDVDIIAADKDKITQ